LILTGGEQQAHEQITTGTDRIFPEPNNASSLAYVAFDSLDVVSPDAHGILSNNISDQEHGRMPEFHGVADLHNREKTSSIQSLGGSVELELQENGHVPDTIGPFTHLRDGEDVQMAESYDALPELSQRGYDQIPNEEGTSRSYVSAINPGSIAFAPQAMNSGLFVFDSSMRAMAWRQGGRKSQADKYAARQLRRIGGACQRHKTIKKKVSRLS
jgi:hypothetical protein